MVFKDQGDYAMFLDLMKKYQEQFGIKVFAFCLMPDHLHLLVEVEKQEDAQPISDFMHGLNNNYTKYYNSRYERKGHLFRERFKSAIIEKESHLLKMTAYLHLNPQRLNSAAEQQTHSSYQMYLTAGGAGESDLAFMRDAVNEALAMLHNKSYAEFVREMTPEEGHVIHKRLQRGGILGSDDFIRMVKEAVQQYQSSGETQKYELDDKKNLRVYVAVAGLVLIFMVSVGAIFLVSINKKSQQVKAAQQALDTTLTLKTLDGTQWQLKLNGAQEEVADVLSFVEGKVYSAYLNAKGFTHSSYSSSMEGKKIIWETIQTRADGASASWRGEIENDLMAGVLSLREQGAEPRDFSFTSINYRRQK